MGTARGRCYFSFFLHGYGSILEPVFTGFQAFAAGLGTVLAVVLLMPDAFIVAELADLDAFFQDMAGMRRVAGHQPRRQRTDIGTVPVGLNTFDHHLHMLFLQTKRGTGLTSGNAFYQYMFQVICSFGFHSSAISE
jgi:hypothetical protein